MNTVPIHTISSGKRGRRGPAFARSFRRGPAGLNGSQLKLLAVLFMTVDHVGLTLVEQGILGGTAGSASAWWYVDLILRGIGRLAFPIFAFLLAEGAFHTRHEKEYGFRLLVFALISEIPFDLALFGSWFYLGYQNVLFTLLISYLSILGIRRNLRHPALQILSAAAGCAAAALLKTDYGAMGVLMTVLLYWSRGSALRTAAGVAAAVIDSISWAGISALAFVPIHFYNGERGRFPGKYFFYIYYPAHLLAFYVLLRLLFG